MITRPDWKLICIAFLVGFAAGAAVVHIRLLKCSGWDKGRLHGRFHPRPDRGRPEGFSPGDSPVKLFSEDLSLDPAQQDKLTAIFEGKRGDFEKFHKECRARFDSIRTATDKEIETILTPKQKKRFEEMKKEMARMEEKGFGPPFPPGPDADGSKRDGAKRP